MFYSSLKVITKLNFNIETVFNFEGKNTQIFLNLSMFNTKFYKLKSLFIFKKLQLNTNI